MRAALAALAALASFAASPLDAQTPTQILVRVTSHDAKIIGSGVGGARVTVRDYQTGAILAEGIQEGSTGNTEAIMVTPRERGATVYGTDGAAGFLARFELAHPTMIEIVAEGPLGNPDGLQRASKTLLAVPGQDILGEGVVIELLGFTVQLLSPEADGERIVAGSSLTVTAEVTMLCGCPTEPGGLWDADGFEVVARLVRDGAVVAEQPLAFAGTRSTYAATMTLPEAGPVELQVLALDPRMGNFGMARRPLEVAPSP